MFITIINIITRQLQDSCTTVARQLQDSYRAVARQFRQLLLYQPAINSRSRGIKINQFCRMEVKRWKDKLNSETRTKQRTKQEPQQFRRLRSRQWPSCAARHLAESGPLKCWDATLGEKKKKKKPPTWWYNQSRNTQQSRQHSLFLLLTHDIPPT